MKLLLIGLSLVLCSIGFAGCIHSEPADLPELIPEFEEATYWSDPPHGKVEKDDNREPISFDSLLSRKMLGRLDKPFGEFSTIQGEWRVDSGRKGEPREFHVNVVDGTKLNDPIIFSDHDVECRIRTNKGRMIQPADGEVWELRTYEAIRSYGTPPNAHMERGFRGQQGMLGWRTAAVLRTLHRPKILYRPNVTLGP